jgi:2,3-bisphosphoglycerate-dependent phosphoglycerate mutase
MSKLILLRHLQSQWNLENRFTGWTDIPLSEEGVKSAKEVAQRLAQEKFDIVYTSPLTRNKESVSLVLGHLGKKTIFLDPEESPKLDKNILPVFVSNALDERNYGKLQGLNKDEMAEKYGKEQIRLWRRSWQEAPPGGESLKDVYNRVVPFYQKYIEKDLEEGKNVLVVASHNSLRALVKFLENISDKDVINLEIPVAGVIIYDFDEKCAVKNKIEI